MNRCETIRSIPLRLPVIRCVYLIAIALACSASDGGDDENTRGPAIVNADTSRLSSYAQHLWDSIRVRAECLTLQELSERMKLGSDSIAKTVEGDFDGDVYLFVCVEATRDLGKRVFRVKAHIESGSWEGHFNLLRSGVMRRGDIEIAVLRIVGKDHRLPASVRRNLFSQPPRITIDECYTK